ncbi:MAG: hypothetical protein EVA58_01110 [Kiritimatiellaceae bacterium]|nr:MAG: hypothetical protein EVA58_01110 [Kiritimatiellaceae bacterium]|tara:strand:+ start:3259 stop:3504 length:246 start_codon:yes stop_codon:yes gene_type:complete
MTVSFSMVVMLWVGLPLLGLAGLAVVERVRSGYRPLREREQIHFCGNCGHVYAVLVRRPMDRCPRCGTVNDALAVNEQSRL